MSPLYMSYCWRNILLLITQIESFLKEPSHEIEMNLMLKMEQLERVNLLETQPPTSIDTLRKRNHSNQMNQYCLKKKRLTDQSDQSFSFCTDLLDYEENEVLKTSVVEQLKEAYKASLADASIFLV